MAEVKTELQKFLAKIPKVACHREVVKIYAPTCYGKCLDAVNKLAKYLSKELGGVTVYDAEGSWYDEEKNRVETEPVKVLQSGHHCLTREEAENLAKAILNYAEEAKQRYISIHEGSFYIAERKAMLKTYEELRKAKPVL